MTGENIIYVTVVRIRWYGYILGMNEERISSLFNMKVEGKCQRGRPRSRWEQGGKKEEERTWKKLRGKGCGKTGSWRGLVVR
jgi:hypothetical protein